MVIFVALISAILWWWGSVTVFENRFFPIEIFIISLLCDDQRSHALISYIVWGTRGQNSSFPRAACSLSLIIYNKGKGEVFIQREGEKGSRHL